jgi:hypothetical protein
MDMGGQAMKLNRTLLGVLVAICLGACAPAALPTAEPVFTQIPTPTAVSATEAEESTVAPTADNSASSDSSNGSDAGGGTGNEPPRTVLDEAQVLPQPGEAQMDRGPVFLDASEVVELEGVAAQTAIHLTGSLPDPCHALRVEVSVPDADNNIQVDVYSIVPNPDMMCVQVLVPFEVSVPLEGLAAGEFRVMVNEQDLGTFTQ